MTKATARLELPFLPPYVLSPNDQSHWTKKYKARIELKEDTYMLAKSQQIPAFKKARITITYVVKDHRRRDGDNWLAMMKGGIDGLVEARVFVDDSAQYVSFAPVQFIVDKSKAPRTIITIEEETVP